MLARSCTAVTAASMVSWWSSLERDIVKSDDFHNGNSFLAYAGRASPVKLKGLATRYC